MKNEISRIQPLYYSYEVIIVAKIGYERTLSPLPNTFYFASW